MSADFLRDGLAWLAATQREQMSQPITYRRKSQSVANVPATLGSADAELTREFGGTQLRVAEKVFWIRAADLVLGGVAVTPKAADLIDIVESGQTNRYRVAPPSTGEPEFQWDEYRIQFKIFAKFMETL